MIAVGLVVRLVVMMFLYQERLNPGRDHYEFAYEYGRVARSLAEGHGFGNVLFGSTGPTALLPPVYPYLLALIFKLFGIYSKASVLVALGLNCVFSVLTCIPVYFIAKRHLGKQCAVYAGWGWTLLPYAIYFSADWLWPTCLLTLLLAILVALVLALDNSGSLAAWLGFGALYGFAALLEPMCLSTLPVLLAWPLYGLYRRKKTWVPQLAASLVGLTLMVSPWFIRNYVVFHHVIPFRDGFGLELRVGNNGYTEHWANTHIRLANNPEEFAEYQRVGEVAYMHHKKEQALEFIENNPGTFVKLTLRRMVYIWTGYWSFKHDYLVGEPLDPPNVFLSTTLTIFAIAGLWLLARAQLRVALLYAGMLLFYPLIYYIVHPEVYYRRPIDPYIVILCVFAVCSRWRSRLRPQEKEVGRIHDPVPSGAAVLSR